MNGPSMVAVPLLASIAIGACSLGLTIGCLLGLLSGVTYMKKRKEGNTNRSSLDSPGQTAANETTIIPLYEDVQQINDMDPIELSCNIAYEQCKKTAM